LKIAPENLKGRIGPKAPQLTQLKISQFRIGSAQWLTNCTLEFFPKVTIDTTVVSSGGANPHGKQL